MHLDEHINRCGRVAAGGKSHILRQIYREITGILPLPLLHTIICLCPLTAITCFTHSLGDASAGRNADESEIDRRVQEAIEMEDPDILMDLRHQNTKASDKYGVFWTKCRKFLDECTAVQERRHDSVCTYMAKAVSVRDLVEQVSKLYPYGTLIPSVQWVRLQFHPKNPCTKAAAQFCKTIPVKMIIQ